MMAFIYACMLTTLILGYLQKEKAALWFCVLTGVLVFSLFLWEIYSPQYGFSMPWISL